MEKSEIKEKLLDLMEKATDVPRNEISESSTLMGDLDISSLGLLIMIADAEDIFDVVFSDDYARSVVTFGDVIDCVYEYVNARG